MWLVCDDVEFFEDGVFFGIIENEFVVGIVDEGDGFVFDEYEYVVRCVVMVVDEIVLLEGFDCSGIGNLC